MSRPCTVCAHPERAAIDKALVSGEAVTAVASRYFTKRGQPLGHMALYRHKDEHLPQALAKAQGAAEVADANGIMAELRRCMERVNLLFDACDRWLRDPDNAEQYDVGPRAEDVKVTYTETGAKGKPVRKKARLSALLAKLEAGGLDVERGEYRHADPRELLLKTSAQLQSHLELLGRVAGQLAQQPTISVLVSSPEWLQVRAALVDALAPFPDARVAVAEALTVAVSAPAALEAPTNGRR